MMLVRLLLLAASVVAIPDPNDPLLLEYRCLLLVLVLDYDYNFCSDYYYDLYYGDYDDDKDYKAPGGKFTFAHILVVIVFSVCILYSVSTCISANVYLCSYLHVCQVCVMVYVYLCICVFVYLCICVFVFL